jgi:hypothetical protein
MATIHVNRGGTSLGTFSEEEVREGLRSGKFAGGDLGWREGMASWQPLSQFSEFSAGVPTGAPPPSAATPPPPSSPMPEPVGPPSTVAAGVRAGLPWDMRNSLGFVNAFIGTMKMVLLEPGAAFTAMKREGGFGEPLIYTVTGGSIGLLFYFLYQFFLTSLGSLGSRANPLAHMVGTGIGSIFIIICVPLLVVIGAFLGSAILHLCLMIVGGARQSFETTFRVVCFTGGSVGPIMIIPFCGGLVAGIWKLVLYCIGLSRAHETETGRAVLAVLLPVLVCCGGGLILGMMFGMLGAWGLSQH